MLSSIFADAPPHTRVRVAVGTYSNIVYLDPAVVQVTSDKFLSALETPTNVYFAPALVREGVTTGDRTSVLCARVLWVDIDDLRYHPPTLPPTFVVRSGHGWHYYYLLDSWQYDLEAIEQCNKMLAEDCDGDRACWNVNRLLRVPGSVNLKEGKPPAQCQLVRHTPVVYTLDELKCLQTLPDKIRAKMQTDDVRGYKTRSERDMAIVRALCNAGASDDFIHKIAPLSAWGSKLAEHPDAAHYLKVTIEKARAPAETSPKADARQASPELLSETMDTGWCGHPARSNESVLLLSSLRRYLSTLSATIYKVR